MRAKSLQVNDTSTGTAKTNSSPSISLTSGLAAGVQCSSTLLFDPHTLQHHTPTTPAKRARGPRLARITTIVCAIALMGIVAPRTANADQVAQLSRTLQSSKYAKARISAVIALGRAKDQRALRPLVRALIKDKSRVVRAVAAKALGHLGNPAALPALQRATRDREAVVRRRAVAALAAIRSGRKPSLQAYATTQVGSKQRKRRGAGFGNRPRALNRRPNLFVVLQSARDESGVWNKKSRKLVAKRMRRLLVRELKSAPKVTTRAADAIGLKKYNLDASITSFSRKARGPYIEVECEIRIAISNSRGKMLSFLTGGAKVQIPKHSFRTRYLPQLRLEALENAIKGINQDVITHLRRKTPS